MKKLSFFVPINAPRQKVWQVLWDDATYRKWTGVFSEGSYAVSDWEEGSRILFLGPDGGGMYSTIARKVVPEIMSFRHIGVLKDGVEQPVTEETKSWSGAMENYLLEETDGGTSLTVTMDIAEQFETYFADAFPKALQEVKALSEAE